MAASVRRTASIGMRRFLRRLRIGLEERALPLRLGIANVKKRNDPHAPGERSGVSIKPRLLAAAFATLVSASAWATQLPDLVASDVPQQSATGTSDPDAVARANWSAYMVRFPSPGEGCFHAAYPSIVWERVPCKIVHPRVHPTPVHRDASG
jgi:hypothetical protein